MLSYQDAAGGLSDSRDDILLTAAALQLTPQNATKWTRLVRLVELAHVIGPSAGRAKLSSNRLRHLLTRAPIADPRHLSQEDPSEEPFVLCIQFFGGNYRVLSGGISGAHVGCQLVLDATRYMREQGHEDFATMVFLETRVLLSLSEAACNRAALVRWASPSDRVRSSLFLPEDLDRLRRAVVFTPRECREIVGIEAEAVIHSLTLDAKVEPPERDRESPVDDLLYTLPLGRTSDGDVVLALPGGVTMSIVHRTLVRALRAGIGDEFVDCLRHAQINALRPALRSMRWDRVGPPNGLDSPTGFHERFYRFDVGKVAHICSVVDTLDGYEPGRPFTFAAMPRVVDELRTRLPAVRAAFRKVPDRGSIFHVVALAPLGRAHAIGFSGDEIDAESELLVASLSDLTVMASEVDADPLGLWAFARAQRRLHDRVHVFSFSTLDEFAIYKDHGDGFYLGDDQYPTMMTVQSDTSAQLRIEAAQRRDVHAAVLPDADGVVLVERWPMSNEQTIYRPISRKYHSYHLVEATAPIWLVPTDTEGPERKHAEDMVEVIAFWLWRCRDLLTNALDSLSERGIRPVVEVSAEIPDPTARSDLEPVSDWMDIAVDVPGRITCRFGSGAVSRFEGPGNAAERVIARQVIGKLYQLAALSDPAADMWPDVVSYDSLVKIVHVLGPNADPVLTIGLGAQPRLVQASAVEVLLDQVGERSSELGLAIGPVDRSSRTDVLNNAADWAFSELWSLLQSLHPAGLLEALALETESIIYSERRASLQIASHAACFGAESAAVARCRRYLTGMTLSAIANRFVIEMATASPPRGEEQLSLASYDRLIALASQIVEFGFLSDAVRYQLADEHMALLASGRLGFDRADPFHAAFSKFGEIASANAMTTAISGYASQWEPAQSDVYDPTDIDTAYRAEFGMSATNLSMLIGELMEYARQADHAVAVRPLDELHAALALSTGLSDSTIAAGLTLLRLEPIKGFDPKRIPRDSYPWKFSRDRSMVRRPLLVRPARSGDEAVWGARATARAGLYLLQQLTSARFRASSAEMQRYVGAITRQVGLEFNRRVAQALRDIGFDDVRERVDKIGGLRLLRPNKQDMGDVDVLIVDRSRKALLVVEAKDFQRARTPQELANEVDKLIGERGSASTHHRERLDFLRDHLPQVLTELDIGDDAARWDVQGMVVTSTDLLGTHYLAVRGLARDLRLVSLATLRTQSPSQLVMPLRRPNPAKTDKRQRRKRRKRR